MKPIKQLAATAQRPRSGWLQRSLQLDFCASVYAWLCRRGEAIETWSDWWDRDGAER